MEKRRNDAIAAYAPLSERLMRQAVFEDYTNVTDTLRLSRPSSNTSCVVATYAKTASPTPKAVSVIGL